MTLDKDDQKIITKIVQKAIDVSVKPEFTNIHNEFDKVHNEFDNVRKEFVVVNRKLDATMEMTAKNTEDINGIDEKIDDIQATSNRVETLAKSEIKYVDELSGRVLTLEKAHK